MTKQLLLKAFIKFFAGLAAFGVLLFLPAGTLRYWNGWLLTGILFIPMLAMGVVLIIKDPALLQKRLNAREEQNGQKWVVALSGIMFLAAFTVAGLNFRFGWIKLPAWSAWAAAAVFLAAYLMYAEVLRENAYLSRTVEVQENQKVIDTGLYGMIRHPMYCATLFLFLSMAFVLGSPVSFAILLLYIPIIAARIKNEEKVLTQGLPGYADYCKRVKHRVIPFLW